jgi:hypothetical protein
VKAFASSHAAGVLLAMLTSVPACGTDTLQLRFPDSPRAPGRIVCGGSWVEHDLRVVSSFVTASCKTESPVRVGVYAGSEARIHEEELPIELMAGREEPLQVRLKLPRQSMSLTLEVSAQCRPKERNEAIFVRRDCVAK